MTVDIVIPFVDADDELWRADHDATGRRFEPERYRTWGTLRYLLRSYAENMPWADVLLVVARESQVPEWYDGRVVFHRDFVPDSYLPTFNVNTIEAYLWNIEGLSDRVIYANDDMFALNKLTEDDFFDGRLPRVAFHESDGYDQNMFRYFTRGTLDYVADYLEVELYESDKLLKMTHDLQPICRWQFDMFRELCTVDLDYRITQFRDYVNITQWAYGFIAYFIGRYSDELRTHKFVKLTAGGIREACAEITNGGIQLLCVADNERISDAEYNERASMLVAALSERFPDKCRYERLGDNG